MVAGFMARRASQQRIGRADGYLCCEPIDLAFCFVESFCTARIARERLEDASRREERREERVSLSLAAVQNAEARP